MRRRKRWPDMYVVGAQPPAVYGASAPKGNYADMTTHGWELSLTWRDQFKMGDKTFTYSVRATLADAKTKVDKYPGNEQKFLNTNWTTGATAYYPGMTLVEKFRAMKMVDVVMPTTDGRIVTLPRYVEPS